MLRRDFLKGSFAGLFGLALNPSKELQQISSFLERRDPFRSLEDRLPRYLRYPRIFVDNNGIAFFDVNNPPKEPTNVAKIKDLKADIMYPDHHYWLIYNFYVQKGETHYFTINNYKGDFETISVTSPCIVYCAYTKDKNGVVKSSGVYHSVDPPWQEDSQKDICTLIDTVRSEPNEIIIFKAVGFDNVGPLTLIKFKKKLKEVLTERGVDMKETNIVLGGPKYRITEFHPKRGQLVTYFTDIERKTYYNLKII